MYNTSSLSLSLSFGIVCKEERVARVADLSGAHWTGECPLFLKLNEFEVLEFQAFQTNLTCAGFEYGAVGVWLRVVSMEGGV